MIEYSNSQISALIDEYIHNERDRAILKRRLIDGKTFDELSDEFNISVRHIKTIVYKQQSSLFKRL
jgi:DNA-directed RNA polymerase sigma subunit (sigma70/sigma32)